jgi:hypothetical protein
VRAVGASTPGIFPQQPCFQLSSPTAHASGVSLCCCCVQDQLSKCEQWVPAHLEIAHLPHQVGQPYGGVFLFMQSARMARPVRYWAAGGGLELLGTLEQSTLDIHCPDGGPGGTPGLRYTHGELSAGGQPRVLLVLCSCLFVWSVLGLLYPYAKRSAGRRCFTSCHLRHVQARGSIQAAFDMHSSAWNQQQTTR